MTVKELIEFLSKENPEAPVYFLNGRSAGSFLCPVTNAVCEKGKEPERFLGYIPNVDHIIIL